MTTIDLAWQPTLDGAPTALAPTFDHGFSRLRRHDLGDGAWVDHAPGWLAGADALFGELLARTPWARRDIRMYERVLPEPRLTHRWELGRDSPPPLLARVARVLSQRYGVAFSHVG